MTADVTPAITWFDRPSFSDLSDDHPVPIVVNCIDDDAAQDQTTGKVSDVAITMVAAISVMVVTVATIVAPVVRVAPVVVAASMGFGR